MYQDFLGGAMDAAAGLNESDAPLMRLWSRMRRPPLGGRRPD
jgi:hypothetical protein